MEPRYSMTVYAVVLSLALAALAARGFAGTAAVISASVALAGAALELSYLIRRKSDRAMPWRRLLDVFVRGQWLGQLVVVGVVLFILGGATPWASAPPTAQALIFGLSTAATAIFVSSMIDWYWILPTISGMTGPAPCERVGGERFAGTTKVWFFHRAVATALVSAVLAGVPGYLATVAGATGAEGAAYVVLGSALAIGYNSVNTGLTMAFRLAFNPHVFVGDILRVRVDPEDRELQDVYLVDVSVGGGKFKPLTGLREQDPRFVDKGASLTMEALAATARSKSPMAPCPGVASCQAANWYCFRNINANATLVGDSPAPAPWPAWEQADGAG